MIIILYLERSDDLFESIKFVTVIRQHNITEGNKLFEKPLCHGKQMCAFQYFTPAYSSKYEFPPSTPHIIINVLKQPKMAIVQLLLHVSFFFFFDSGFKLSKIHRKIFIKKCF